jgi:hypothetical protein
VVLLLVNHFRKIKRDEKGLQYTGGIAAAANTKRRTGIHLIVFMGMRCFMRQLIFAGIGILTRRQGDGENVTGEEVDEVFH